MLDEVWVQGVCELLVLRGMEETSRKGGMVDAKGEGSTWDRETCPRDDTMYLLNTALGVSPSRTHFLEATL